MITVKASDKPAWVEVSEKTKPNSQTCEVCGGISADLITRKAYHTYGEKRRTNRRRIPDWYFTLFSEKLEKAGINMNEWVNKLVCYDCYKKFSDAMNRQ